ncbi:serine-rich adhesin for platelets-like isoform X2 [Littorina saxatilis]
MGLHCLLRVICLVALVTSVHGRRDGAPVGACSTLTPGHPRTTPATTASPFSISFTPATFTPGGSAVTVTIATTDAAQNSFQGFLLTTQSTSDGSVKLGTFALINGSKFVCDPLGSAVTHTSAIEKISMEFKWTPPTTSQGHVRFRATFLKDYSTYWVDVRAGSLLLDSTLPTPGPTTAGTTQAAVTTPAPVAPTGRLTNDAGCGSAKGCYSKCSGTDCDFVMTWEQGTSDSNVRMTLSGIVGGSQGSYIALGLSKDDKMSDDSVMYCIKEGVYNAYNNDGSKFSQTLTNNNEQAGLSDITATLKDGVLTCSFLRDTAASSNGQQFALDQNYTLFFATGSATPDNIGKHSQAPLISPLAASLQDFSVNIGGPTTQAAVTTPAPVAPTGRLTNDAGCGRAKGCYSKCSGTDCDFVMTWEQGTSDSNVRMTLSGIVGGSQGSYIALGLSKDDKMSDDSVMYCIKEGVYNAYNDDGSKSSQRLTNNNEQAGLSDITATLKDGVLTCSFLRDTAASSNGQQFALDQNYTLFFATGSATPDNIGKHSQAPLISPLAASLQDFSVNIGGPTTQAAVTTPAPVAPTGRLTNDAGCGSAKGCYSKCSGTDCDFVMTWEQGTSDSNVRMTLSGIVGGSQGSYIALGLSKDDKMSDDSVMYCIKEGVYNAYNNDGSKFSQTLTNNNEQAGLSDITATLKDGVLTCSFLRDTAASSNGQQFALDQNYTLFFATGSATPDNIGKHSQAPLISPLAASLQDFSVNIGGPTTQAAVTTPAPVAPTGRLTNDAGCGSAKGCYSKCSGTDCDFVMTWEQGTSDSNVRMTLSGIVGGSQGSYIALGLSKDDKMSDDSVMYCIKEGVYNAYNNDGSKSSQRLSNNNEQAGLSNITATLKDGVLTCSFLRDTAESSNRQQFALDRDYTLFFATGSATPDYIGKHSQAPLISSLAASLQDFSVNIGGSADFPVLVKAHGSLMMVAWIFAASLGIIFARHFKTMWEGSSWFGEKVWFQIHRACMIIAFLATVVAFIIIFVEVGGYSEIEGEGYKEAHPIIGIIVTILTVINPVLAVFRPHPGTKNRPIFNWVHWAVGTAAYILGVISIFFGLTLDKAGAPDYATYILAAFVGWQFLVSILLEIAQCMGRNSGRSNMYEMSDMNGGDASKPPQVAESNFYKQVLIILHVFVVSGFTIALIVVLNIGSDE